MTDSIDPDKPLDAVADADAEAVVEAVADADPSQLDLGLEETDEAKKIVRGKRRNAIDKVVFRQDRSVLLARNMFVLNPKEYTTFLGKFGDTTQSATLILSSTVKVDKETTVTFKHPPLGPNDQALLNGLALLAEGDIRGSKRTFSSNDSSQPAQWAWQQLGPDSQLFGDVLLVLTPSKNQLTQAVKLGRDKKSLSSKDTEVVLESLANLSQVFIELRTKSIDGKDIVAGAHLISSYKGVDDELTITLNPHIMKAVMGIPGSFTLISADEIRKMRTPAAQLLLSKLSVVIDGGEIKRFRDDTLEEYIYGDIIPHDKDPKRIAERKNRRRIIVKAMDNIAKAGWEVTYNKGATAGEGFWMVIRPRISNPLSTITPSPNSSGSDDLPADLSLKRKRVANYRGKKTI